MNVIAEKRWRPSAVIGALLVTIALALVACAGGGSSTPSGDAAATPTQTPTPTPTTIPEAAPGTGPASGTVQACAAVDVFYSSYTGADGQSYWVTVKLGESDSPAKGDVGMQATFGDSMQPADAGPILVVGSGAGVAYAIPQGEVQTTFADPSGSSLVVVFTAQQINEVTIMGDGGPEELQRQE